MGGLTPRPRWILEPPLGRLNLGGVLDGSDPQCRYESDKNQREPLPEGLCPGSQVRDRVSITTNIANP
jgi:hypothetical protein